MASRRSDKGDADEAEVRGVAEHVGSGRREPFRDARELLAFLQTEHRRTPEEVDGK